MCGRCVCVCVCVWQGTCILVIVTACQQSYEKVMSAVVSVCHSVCPQWDPHVTITHDALDLTVHCTVVVTEACMVYK